MVLQTRSCAFCQYRYSLSINSYLCLPVIDIFHFSKSSFDKVDTFQSQQPRDFKLFRMFAVYFVEDLWTVSISFSTSLPVVKLHEVQ